VSYQIVYTRDAKADLDELDNSQRLQVLAAIAKVSKNPLPKSDGGYGNALGNKLGENLTGLLKIKLLKLGIRVVYKLIHTDKIMKIIVIAARADNEVYSLSAKRSARE
jgi:mRNA interferase RelE/StbE